MEWQYTDFDELKRSEHLHRMAKWFRDNGRKEEQPLISRALSVRFSDLDNFNFYISKYDIDR
jgi:hypothetical protein